MPPSQPAPRVTPSPGLTPPTNMPTIKAFTTSTRPDPPYIIWVERVRLSSLLLTVLAPKRSWVPPFRHKPKIVHKGPVLPYSSPSEEVEVTEALISAGVEHVPYHRRHFTALSHSEVQTIIEESWKQ